METLSRIISLAKPKTKPPVGLMIFGTDFGVARTIARKLAFADGVLVLQNEDPSDLHSATQNLPWYDVVGVDIDHCTVDAFALIEQLAALRPDRPVVVFSSRDEIELVLKAISAGATGYLIDGELNTDQVVEQLEAVRNGWPAMGPGVTKRLMAILRDNDSLRKTGDSVVDSTAFLQPSDTAEKIQELSVREREVLKLSANGLVGKEIAGRLSISPHTITTHFKNIYRKLEVHTRGEAVFVAQTAGLI